MKAFFHGGPVHGQVHVTDGLAEVLWPLPIRALSGWTPEPVEPVAPIPVAVYRRAGTPCRFQEACYEYVCDRNM